MNNSNEQLNDFKLAVIKGKAGSGKTHRVMELLNIESNILYVSDALNHFPLDFNGENVGVYTLTTTEESKLFEFSDVIDLLCSQNAKIYVFDGCTFLFKVGEDELDKILNVIADQNVQAIFTFQTKMASQNEVKTDFFN